MTIERKLLGTVDAAANEAVYIEDTFSTTLYTGTGSSQTITNGIDLATNGGIVWIKGRSGDYSSFGSRIIDTLGNAELITSSTAGSNNVASAYSFTTSGYGLSGGGYNGTNGSNTTYASWTFRKQAKFFDIVTYTGTGSARTISHNLGSTPGMIIVKRTDNAGNWQVYHRSLTSAANSIQLNLTDAQASATTVWNSTAPTSSVFSVGTDATVNASGGTYVAYLFAHDAGGFGAAGTDSVVSCGSYTGGGSASSPAVTLGWEPQFILIKNVDTSASPARANWVIFDNMRGLSTSSETPLAANLSTAEGGTDITSGDYVDPTATGFVIDKAKSGLWAVNESGKKFIYLAIRRGPMKTPTDATKVFDSDTYSGNATANRLITTGFPVDMVIGTRRNDVTTKSLTTRLTGTSLRVNDTIAEEASRSTFDSNIGNLLTASYPNSSGDASVQWAFRRAPGFFDVVCYTGTGSTSQTVNHNLGVVPEMIILKCRSNTTEGAFPSGWYVVAKSGGGTGYWFLPGLTSGLNYSGASSYTDVYSTYFSSTSSFVPWSVTLSNGGGGPNGVISGYTYVAYLFASCPGVSKVGSYTGNGSSQTINCGFASGARFVLIKRTDSAGDWFCFDSARGIVSANDPHLSLNTTAAEVTTDDTIDPDNTGFIVNQVTATNVNVSSATYIYLAIA